MTTQFSITRGDEVIAVSCQWRYYPPSRGMRDSLGGVRGAGPPLEPDDPAELEFLNAEDATGNEVELTRDERHEAERDAWKHFWDNASVDWKGRARYRDEP